MRILFIACAMLISVSMQANTYYFSSSGGNDSRSFSQAQDPQTPWKSLDKLNAVFGSLRGGDAILFKRGDVFYGSVAVTQSGNTSSPISFGAYGSGDKPVITGFTSSSNWSSSTPNVWETVNNTFGSSVNMVLINGFAKRIGRFPNADQGFLYYENFVANTSVTDSKLSGSNFTGGDIVIRKNRWVVDKSKISLQVGSLINYISQSGYWPEKGNGYFIQNHIKTLDQDEEWYYNSAEKKLGIYSSHGSSALQNVQASSIDVLVTVNNQTNISFDNIAFTGANTQTFYIKNSKNIHITNCDLLFSGGNAVTADNADYISIENCNINHTNNIAFNGIYCTNTILRNNKVTCTGIYAGMGDGDSGSYEALMLTGDNNLVELNSIDSTGYIPITFSGNNTTIKNNFISNYAFVKDDGGAIYTWNNSNNAPANYGRKVTGNMVINGIGAADGTADKTKKYAHGIYIDDNASNVDISGNTVANCEGFGLYIHNSRSLSITNNTIYNNQVQLEMQHDDIAPNAAISNNTVTDNILFSLAAMQPVAEFKTKDNDLANFGNFDNNYYCRPIDDNTVINTLKMVNGSYQFNQVDLEGWQSMYGKDGNSKKTAKQIAPYKIIDLSGTNKFSNGTFNDNIGGLYSFSPANNFTSQWRNGPLDGGSLQVAFSGIAGNGNKGTVIINVGAVTANKAYILRFSNLGAAENKMLEVYLRKSFSPYTDLSDRKLTKIKSTRTETEFLFVPTETEQNASIGIDVPEQINAVYIDNIQLLEASVVNSNVSDSVRFVYNANATANSFSLPNSFIDVKSTPYTGSISLNAFSSAILLNNSGNLTVTPPAATCSATGNISYEEWQNIGGNDISNDVWNKTPSSSKLLNAFEGAENAGENYASRIRGYLCPPQTGNYTFWIAGDDATELWLSTDDNPTNKNKIAYSLNWTNSREWNKAATQKSVQIYLQAGKKYYIEALHQQGRGGDNFAVAWQLPDGTFEGPIPGIRLSPFTPTQILTSDQIIFFSTPADVTYGVAPFTLSARSSSNLPVIFRVVSGPATINGNTITISGTGVITVEATQPGNEAFNAAPIVIKTFNVLAAAAGKCSATGTILREVWNNVGGNNISDNNWSNPPNNSNILTSFEGPENAGDNYASRIRGYICPPQTGNYTFWIAGDDGTELWLSTSDDPATKVKIAYSLIWTGSREWEKFSTQKSVQIFLEAGKKYYVEALQKQGGGGNSVAVAWQLPDGTKEAPMSGASLSPYVAEAKVLQADQSITFNSIADVIYGVAPFALSATASSGLPVTFAITSGPATVTGNTVNITGTGTVGIAASQTGNASFNAAPVVVKTFNVSPAPSNSCSATGTILHEIWNNVRGNNVSDNDWSRTPNSTDYLTLFEGVNNFSDNYASRIRGYICPPQTGNYTFWIAGDDATELWLSTNADVANKTKIAYNVSWVGSREWERYSTQKSAQVFLEAGKKYYIEALHKEGAGGDNLAVAWQLPDGSREAPIAGTALSPFATYSITQQARISALSETNQNVAVAEVKEVEASHNPGLRVFPNPVITNATVQIQSAEAGVASLKVYDIQNRLLFTIFQGQLEQNTNKKFSINVGSLSSGLYIIKYSINNKVYVQKVIVGKK